MNSIREYIIYYLNSIRCLPHILVYLIHKNRAIIKIDIRKGLELRNKSFGTIKGLIYLLAFSKSYRNIFYYRVTPYDFFLNIICPKFSSLMLNSESIGEGFVISHGLSSAIGASSIGKYCTVFQQVTIGAAGQFGSPTIMDNVTIYAGAIVLGNITIGNNVVIGANSTVLKSIPDNCTVLPVSSKIMHWKK